MTVYRLTVCTSYITRIYGNQIEFGVVEGFFHLSSNCCKSWRLLFEISKLNLRCKSVKNLSLSLSCTHRLNSINNWICNHVYIFNTLSNLIIIYVFQGCPFLIASLAIYQSNIGVQLKKNDYIRPTCLKQTRFATNTSTCKEREENRPWVITTTT